MIDYDAIATAGGLGKGPPRAVAKDARTRAENKLDRAESAKVRQRSGGRCEVVELFERDEVGRATWRPRCPCRAREVHHMIGGRGRRGRHLSALAERKQHVCSDHHLDITGGVGGKRLKLIQVGLLPVYTDRYVRVR